MERFLQRWATLVSTRGGDAAVVHEGAVYNYRAVNAAADRLAWRLWERRQGDNDIVGYYGAVGIARSVAMLACAKTGMALFILDPEQPEAALHDLVDHSRMAHLICGADDANEAATQIGVAPVTVEVALDAAADEPAFASPPENPDAIYSIQYTSGSTGRPKGVPRRRGQMDALHLTRRDSGHLGLGDRVAIFNQFWSEEESYALASGAQIECFDFRRHGPARMGEWLAERQVTRLATYVAMYRAMMAASSRQFPAVRTVELAGEFLVRDDIEQFDRRFGPDAVIINRFASTETSTIAEYTHRRGDPIDYDTVPIGEIVTAGDLYVVNEHDRPVADGEPGEMVLIWDKSPVSYHNDPERTAQVFEPAFDGSGRLQIRTGFMVFRDHRGMLHPVGRKDEQVKIRGYNVRPSEVEQMLLAHPGVAKVAVAAFDGPHGIRRLACHFVPAAADETGEPLTPGLLRAFLAARAANYMVPSVFLAHDELPTTANGKIHRQKLPDPMAALAGIARAEPADETERTLVAIWRDVLGHGDFATDEDFFDVGGDSLQAMAVLIETEAKLGVRVPMESLILQGASIQALRARIDAVRGGALSGGTVMLKEGDRSVAEHDAPVFVTHVRGGHLSDYVELLHAMHRSRTVYGLHPKGMDGVETPDNRMEALAAHCAAAMIQRQPEGAFRLMGYSYGSAVALATIDALVRAGRTVSHLVLLDPIAPWNDKLRDLRSIGRPLKQGDAPAVWRRLSVRVGDAVGLEAAAARDLDEAHRLALLRFRPGRVAAGRILIVSARENRDAVETRRELTRWLAGNVDAIEHAGDHMSMLRQPHVLSLAPRIDAWLDGLVLPDRLSVSTGPGEARPAI